MFRTLLGTTAVALTLSAMPVLADVKVGSIVELSGPGAAAGTNFHDGVKMGFEEINAAGGILGENVELSQYDSQTDPQVKIGRAHV